MSKDCSGIAVLEHFRLWTNISIAELYRAGARAIHRVSEHRQTRVCVQNCMLPHCGSLRQQLCDSESACLCQNLCSHRELACRFTSHCCCWERIAAARQEQKRVRETETLGRPHISFALPQVDIRLRVKGGGFTGQIYALRQAELRAMPLSSCSSSAGIFRKAVAKGIVAYYQKFIDEVPRS